MVERWRGETQTVTVYAVALWCRTQTANGKRKNASSRRVPLPGSWPRATRPAPRARPPRAARPGVGPAHTAARAPPDVHVGRSFAPPETWSRVPGHTSCLWGHMSKHARFTRLPTRSLKLKISPHTKHSMHHLRTRVVGRRLTQPEDQKTDVHLAATPRITARLTGHRQPRGALGAAAPVQASPRLSRSRRGSPSPSRRACPAHGWKTAARRP